MHGNTKDLTGRTFGRLTVIEKAPSDSNGHTRWQCRCECGTEKIVLGDSLVRGNTLSCGCLRRETASKTKHYADLTGKRFSRLTVVSLDHISKNGDAHWLCQCDCGKQTTATKRNLEEGETMSCGCYRASPKKHGQTCGGNSRIYRIWTGMKQRCNNPNRPKYPRYGGRGIRVCDEWQHDFSAFFEWALANGYTDDMTIDRIDNDGDYTPNNCRWLTSAENTKHRFESERSRKEASA